MLERTLISAKRVYRQAEYCREAAEALGPGTPTSEAILRGGFVLLVAGFERFNTRVVIELLHRQKNLTPAAIDPAAQDGEGRRIDPSEPLRIQLKKLDGDFRKLRIGADGSVTKASAERALERYTLNRPHAIDSCLRIFDVQPEKVWMGLALDLELYDPEDARKVLNLIVDRRNMIAHDGDWHDSHGQLRRMTIANLEESRKLIQRATERIVSVVEETYGK